MELEDKYHFKDISFLDFSLLGESNLYLDGIYTPHVHNDDIIYLREIACKIDCCSQENSLTYPLSKKGLTNCEIGFKINVKMYYMDKECLFPELPGNTLLKDLMMRGLMFWEPRDLSCSWIGNNLDDYVLRKIGDTSYIKENFDNPLRLIDIVDDSYHDLELELIEKTRVEFETSTLLPRVEKELFRKTVIKSCIPSFTVKEDLVILFSFLGGINQQYLKDFAVYASYEDIVFDIKFELRNGENVICTDTPIIKVEYNKIGKPLEETIYFPIKINKLSRESYIRVYITASRVNFGGFKGFFQNILFMESSTPNFIGWADYPIYNFQSFLNKSIARTNIRQSLPTPFYLSCSEMEETAYISLSVRIPFEEAIFFNLQNFNIENPLDTPKSTRSKIKERDWEKIKNDKASDTILWKYRYEIKNKLPGKLITLLKSVDWEDEYYIYEIQKLIKQYPIIHPFAGLEILSMPIVDLITREYAVKCLQGLSNEEIISILPQLVQSLKREMYICGPLSQFLLTKALRNKGIGYVLYWHLKSEMDEYIMFSRFSVLKQCYLENIDCDYRREILAIERIFEDLIILARLMQKSKLSLEEFRTRLYEIRFPTGGCCLPSSYKIKIRNLCIEDCTVLNSKTKPLWLTFNVLESSVSEGEDSKIYAILKIGDDIRIDGLALQMMEILDGLWKKEGLDLHLQPYATLPLKQKVGLIQVANKAETTSSINWKHGGNGFTSAFSSTSLKAFLYKNNNSRERKKAFKNFALSCAGYCVFTYIFGVGDRHGDNIMCTKDGNLFHIDFGYFLGERTRFLGFSRETNYFVLTPNYINAMDDFFDLFVESACTGFAIAGRYENIFTTLITLMLPCSQEIITQEQLSYVRKSLEPWMSEKEAKRKFYNIIRMSLQDKRTLINDFAHLIATRNSK